MQIVRARCKAERVFFPVCFTEMEVHSCSKHASVLTRCYTTIFENNNLEFSVAHISVRPV
eukprot:c26313_g1_i1 orf=1-177(-)